MIGKKKIVFGNSLANFQTFMTRTGVIIYGWSPSETKIRETVSRISDSANRVRSMGVTEICVVIPQDENRMTFKEVGHRLEKKLHHAILCRYGSTLPVSLNLSLCRLNRAVCRYFLFVNANAHHLVTRENATQMYDAFCRGAKNTGVRMKSDYQSRASNFISEEFMMWDRLSFEAAGRFDESAIRFLNVSPTVNFMKVAGTNGPFVHPIGECSGSRENIVFFAEQSSFGSEIRRSMNGFSERLVPLLLDSGYVLK